MTDIPEFDDIVYIDNPDDEFEVISVKSTGTWRHGTEHSKIVKRKSDGAFFLAVYSTTPEDGICYDRGDMNVVQVYPHAITTVVYKTEPPSE